MERKATHTAIIALIIGFVIYSLICVLLFETSFSFWIELSFALIAFAICVFTIYRQSQTPRFFLRLPIYVVAVAYLIAQLIASVLFMICPAICNPWGYALSILLLGGFLCIALTSQASTEHIASIDSQINEDTSFIESLQIQLKALKDKLPDNQQRIDKLIDTARFSNLRSCSKAEVIEKSIQSEIEEVHELLQSGKTDRIASLLNKIEKQLNERNRICKLDH